MHRSKRHATDLIAEEGRELVLLGRDPHGRFEVLALFIHEMNDEMQGVTEPDLHGDVLSDGRAHK
jgi:hypothetical protein